MIKEAVKYIKTCLNGRKPVVAIILGSGLGSLADKIEDPAVIPYREIPGFPVSTAIGHKGNLICGQLGGKCVMAMQGRFHYYEGYTMQQVTLPVRVLGTMGIRNLFVSNAAGACNPEYEIGDLVVIKDHINMLPNPLIGPNMDEYGERFPDMTCAYDINLQKTALRFGREMGLPMRNGVYLGSSGPTYETPAEVRFFRAIGADMLGMSTIPEVIVARHCGMRVFGVSVATNKSNTTNKAKVLNDSVDVVKQGDKAADGMIRLFTRMIAEAI